MKNLFTFIVVVLFSAASFAQGSKPSKANQAAATSPSGHECYMMKDGVLIHCMGEKNAPQKTNVTLKNGTVIGTDGTIKTADETQTKLENGQCITLMGSIGDCGKMHAAAPTEIKADPKVK